MKHKKLFISLTAVFSVIIFLAMFLMIWFFGDSYADFELFKQEFEIPGLNDGSSPQGMGACLANYTVEEKDENGETTTVTKTQQYFFISAYMSDGSASRIYVTGEDTGYVGYVTLKNTDGTDYTGHCGGIAINNNISTITTTSAKYYTLWVTGEGNVYVAKPSAEYIAAKKTIAQEIIEKAAGIPLTESDDETEKPDKSIQFTTSFNANCNASFCYYFDDPSSTSYTVDRLYVGEFYREGNYETDKKHRLTTPNGYQNTAFMYEFNVSTSTDFGLTTLTDAVSTVPKIQKIFSLPEQVQGIALSGKKNSTSNEDCTLILSQSYGLPNSHLLCFDFNKVSASTNRVAYKTLTGENFAYEGVFKKAGENASVPYTESSSTFYVYFVDKANTEMFVKDYSIPCMSEGMCVLTPSGSYNDPSYRVYVLFESGSKKYNKFVRQQLKSVYSFIPHAG